MPLTVVSTPALSNERDERRFLLGELTGLGCGMDRRAEAAGRERVALHLSLEPCQNRFGIPDRCLEKFVARAKGVEHHIAVRQQEMPVFTRHPHCVGKYGQRVGLGEIGDRIAAAALQKLVDKLVCLRGETLAQAPYHRRGQHPVQYRRVRSCIGGSASSTRLFGRQGCSLAKSVRPAPRLEQKVCQSLSTMWTSA